MTVERPRSRRRRRRTSRLVPRQEQRDEQQRRRPPRRATRRRAAPQSRGSPAGLRRLERVAQQHRDRHRADAAGHRRDQPRRARPRASKSTSPSRPCVGAVDADVDHHRALLDPVALDEAGPADGGDQHVGAAADLGEVARARVAGRDGRVARPAAARATGLPTRSERPTTTASAPSSVDVVAAQQLHARRAACTAAGPGGPWPAGRRRSASARRRPWPGRSPRSAPPPSICGGVGSWSRMPETRGSSLSSCSSALDLACGVSAGSRWSKPRDADLGASPSACRRRRRPTRGRRRPARSPARAARGPPRPRPRPRSPPRRAPAARSPCRR